MLKVPRPCDTYVGSRPASSGMPIAASLARPAVVSSSVVSSMRGRRGSPPGSPTRLEQGLHRNARPEQREHLHDLGVRVGGGLVVAGGVVLHHSVRELRDQVRLPTTGSRCHPSRAPRACASDRRRGPRPAGSPRRAGARGTVKSWPIEQLIPMIESYSSHSVHSRSTGHHVADREVRRDHRRHLDVLQHLAEVALVLLRTRDAEVAHVEAVDLHRVEAVAFDLRPNSIIWRAVRGSTPIARVGTFPTSSSTAIASRPSTSSGSSACPSPLPPPPTYTPMPDSCETSEVRTRARPSRSRRRRRTA